MHTGCLSAAPQRFVIGSNSFRTRTCFEVPLHAHCILRAKPASNRQCVSSVGAGLAQEIYQVGMTAAPGTRDTSSGLHEGYNHLERLCRNGMTGKA